MQPPTIVFGAGGIGNTAESFTFTWTTPESVSSLLSTLQELQLLQLDSAASYPPGNPWDTERLLGEAQAVAKGFVIDSKIAIHEGPPTLNDEAIPRSLSRTLSLLGATKVRTLYSHAPDPVTHIEVTAAAYDREFKLGKFERLGLCNYSVEQLEEYFSVCESKGYVKPAVYQGHYNLLVRSHEAKLMPLLRKHGCAYFAYSPLGGGFLTGKVTFPSSTTSTAVSGSTEASPLHRTRWEGKSEMSYYTRIFNQPLMHAALRDFKATLDEYHAQHAGASSGQQDVQASISLTEASLRWLMHHSELAGERGDGVIVGAKREDQLRDNVALCRNGPLPDVLVTAMNQLWDKVKDIVDPQW